MPLLETKNSLQFILQLTEIDLWKYELLILEDMKMRKSFSKKEFLKKNENPFQERMFSKNMKFLSGKGIYQKKPKKSFTGKDFLFFWENPFPERIFSFLADIFMSI